MPTGASHFCRNNLLWGGHPARPLALTGFPACHHNKMYLQNWDASYTNGYLGGETALRKMDVKAEALRKL
ncbi:MAG: hypothetical protein F6K28_38540 [Microcoleus sp. SIO2G3]|nr:hypothetical protein [Microcoleus sp. SIO2G3]